MSPGQQALLEQTSTQESKVAAREAAPPQNLFDVERLTDDQIYGLLSALQEEQQRRAVEDADPEALIKQAFGRMFTSKGSALEPEIVSGVLVCPGSLRNQSQTTHECTFVHVNEYWCFEHPDQLGDEVRKLPAQGREHQRSVTVIPVSEGDAIDMVTCKATQRDGHRAKQVVSFTVADGMLEKVSVRSAPSTSPRM